MSYSTIETIEQDGVAWIWLNRPDVRNAMNDVMISELNHAVQSAIDDSLIRVIVLAGRGKAFCAGGDLNWMRKAKDMKPDEAINDSLKLAQLLQSLYQSPKPTVACVHGSAFAGGMGLVAACDIAIASSATKFCLSEVKLGLIPAMISPYVIRAMGERAARRYFLTAEVFEAAEAYRIGLINELCSDDELDAQLGRLLAHLLQGAPSAQANSKQLIRDVQGQAINSDLAAMTAKRIATIRVSDEAQEGIAAFFEKRQPAWQRPNSTQSK